ncbi:MAG: hypothetical protein LBE57_03250 [Methanosarcinales archaeon]|jgi:hypothetical protein|nr:hypothetical protein [Methanosarcinales archaeon]
MIFEKEKENFKETLCFLFFFWSARRGDQTWSVAPSGLFLFFAFLLLFYVSCFYKEKRGMFLKNQNEKRSSSRAWRSLKIAKRFFSKQRPPSANANHPPPANSNRPPSVNEILQMIGRS